jgi:peptidoglycan/xylan/chitin deacetylase (PgdA/CDA1 family)/glycosyltransferase involved in cell wall biosynthesis
MSGPLLLQFGSIVGTLKDEFSDLPRSPGLQCMNILHVLSQFEVTGAETLAATIADRQIAAGHRVTIVSDTFHAETAAEVLPLPIGKRDILQRVRNIAALRAIIRERSIHLVHAHSRAASWVSYFATRGGHVPLVSMIHGKQHVHFSSKHSKIFGEKLVAVCEELGAHLPRDLGYASRDISVIRNGIDLEYWHPIPVAAPVRQTKIIALVGRLSGPKGEVARKIIENVFPLIYSSHPGTELHIVGGMIEADWVTGAIARTNARLGVDAVRAVGFVKDVRYIYSASALVIGSGRVAMEALACGAQVIAVGESSYVGLVTEATGDRALATNFGDAGDTIAMSEADAVRDIRCALDREPAFPRWGIDFASKAFDAVRVTRELFLVYADAIASKRGITEIPVLMYHRVTDGIPRGTKHGIFVTANEFDLQLRALRRKGCTTLTLRDVRDIVRGDRIIPRRPVLLTFDDGYEDNYRHAFPLLKKYGMTATIFLLGDPSVRSNVWDAHSGEPEAPLLTDAQCREMLGHGMDFGAHTLHHVNLPGVSHVTAKREIEESKQLLEHRLQYEITSLAYPYGAVNEEIKALTRAAGFTFGVATDSGTKNIWKDLFEIRRIPVFPGASRFSFWKKTTGKYHAYKKVE